MPKILMIHPRYREYRRELFNVLARNFDISFLFIAKPPREEDISGDFEDDFPYNCLNLPDKRIRPNLQGPGLGLFGLSRLIFLLSRTLISNSSEIIITSTQIPIHSKIAFFWSKIFGKKILVWTETWANRKGLFSKLVDKFFSNPFLKNADAVLVHGTNQKNYCRDVIGVPEEKIFIFNHCSVDKANLNIQKDFKEVLGIKDKKVVLYFGRLIKRKGLGILLQAFNSLENCFDDVHLLVCGKGEYEDSFKELSGILGINNISFLGFVDFNLVTSIYNASDVFCLPSYVCEGGGMEGWGLSLNEAASMGLPIITTDAVGGALDLVKNGYNGFVVKNGDVEELYEALNRILSDDELRKKMGKNSRRIFEYFNDYGKAISNLKKAIEFVKNKNIDYYD